MKWIYIYLTFAIALLLGILLFSDDARAQAFQIFRVSQGGTGWGNITANTLLTGNGTGKLATTTIGSGLNLSGGVLTATASGNVSTSTAETAGRIPFWDSTAASPALLNGGSSLLTFNGTKLSATYASTTALTVSGTAYFPGSGIWNSSGNVGIGTTTPFWALTVASSTGPQLALVDTTASSNAWTFRNIANTLYIATSTATATSTYTALTINPNGFMGIGTVAPAQMLDVQGNVQIGDTTSSAFIEVGFGAVSNRFAFIDFVGDTTYTDYGLRLIRGNSGANAVSALDHRGTGALQIKTTDSAPLTFLTTATERMRITDAGNVGIGTTTPGAKFAVAGGNIMVENGQGLTSGTGATITTGAGGGTWIVQAGPNSSSNNIFLAKDYGGTTKVTIDPTGNVGIGSVTPNGPLHVASTTVFDANNARTSAHLSLEQVSGTQSLGAFGSGISFGKIGGNRPGAAISSVQTSSDADQLGLAFFTHSGASTNDIVAEMMRIDHAGNVGIGTTTPDQKLVVTGATTPILKIENMDSQIDDNEKVASLQFYGNDASSAAAGIVGQIYSYGTGGTGRFDNMAFDVWNNGTPTTALTLQYNGNVGIGTTSPAFKLTNSNQTNVTDGSIGLAGSNSFVWEHLSADSATGYTAAILNSVSGTSYNGLLVKTTDTSANSKIFAANSNGTDRLTILGSGNVGIGTTTPSHILTATNATKPQLSLTDTTGTSNAWTMRSISNSLFIATSTYAATSSFATIKIDPNGHIYFPQLTVDADAHTYTMCGEAGTFQAVWDTTTCVLSRLESKTNVFNLDIGLAELMKLRPVMFNWKPTGDARYDNDRNVNHQQIGLIADEVEKIDSRLVTYDNEGNVKGFRYDFFTAWLAQSIQELNEKVENGVVYTTESVQDKWQNILIGLLLLGFIYQQVQIRRLKKPYDPR